TTSRPPLHVRADPTRAHPVGTTRFVSPAGTVSLTVYPDEMPSPLLVTVREKLPSPPARARTPSNSFVKARSAGDPIEAAASLLPDRGPVITETTLNAG